MTAPLLLAVAIAGLPWWNDGGIRGAGAVVIAGAKPSVLIQSSAAVPGDPEPGDGFGTALARGDFDGDGRVELAVGAPAEAAGTGAVTVLNGARSQLLPGPAPTNPDFSAHFGAAIAAGDLNRDGFDDLAVGAPGDDPAGSDYDAGTVRLLFGSPDGLTPGTRVLRRPRRSDASFGSVLALGDIDQDGHLDVVEGGFGNADASDGDEYPGQVAYCRGGTAGPTVCRALDRRSAPGPAALAVGDVTGDGFADIVAGLPADHFDREDEPAPAGALRLWPGSRRGPVRRPLVITQRSRGIPGTSEPNDEFGAAVAVGNLDRDGHAEIVVGAPGEDRGRGRVTVVRGARGGYKRKGNRTYDRSLRRLPRVRRRWGGFGTALTLAARELTIAVAREGGRPGALVTLPRARHGLPRRAARVLRLAPLGHAGPDRFPPLVLAG